MLEKDVLQKLSARFNHCKDFEIAHEISCFNAEQSRTLIDVVVYYGGKPIACAEIKDMSINLKEYLLNQLHWISSEFSSVVFCFAVVGETFYYFDSEEQKLEKKTEEDVFDLLINSVESYAEKRSHLAGPILEQMSQSRKWEPLIQLLDANMSGNNLLGYGGIVFLSREAELNFMKALLTYKSKMPCEVCRYTSAKNFYLSLKDKFWINSVEAMNDELETKVINACLDNKESNDDSKEPKVDLVESLYKGFIVSFSRIDRMDQLSSWYMYGDKAKGVCFSAKWKTDEGIVKSRTADGKNDDIVLFAPVRYVSPDYEDDLYQFIDKLMGLEIDGEYRFRLRYWVYWKYFFKFDYYEEEKEIRLLYVRRNGKKLNRNGLKNTPHLIII